MVPDKIIYMYKKFFSENLTNDTKNYHSILNFNNVFTQAFEFACTNFGRLSYL